MILDICLIVFIWSMVGLFLVAKTPIGEFEFDVAPLWKKALFLLLCGPSLLLLLILLTVLE